MPESNIKDRKEENSLTFSKHPLNSSMRIPELKDLPRETHLEFVVPERSSRSEPLPHRRRIQDTSVRRGGKHHLYHELHIGKRGENATGRVQHGTEVILSHQNRGSQSVLENIVHRTDYNEEVN